MSDKVAEYNNMLNEVEEAQVAGWNFLKGVWKFIKVLIVMYIVFMISIIIFGVIVS